MYSNIIMGFVSPSPPSSTSESNYGLGSLGLDDDEILSDYGQVGTNMTAMLACLSETPVHHLSKGLLGSHPSRELESPSLSYKEDDWGGTETHHDWTIDDVSRHANDESTKTTGFNYNNYQMEDPHNTRSFDLSSINRALSGIQANYDDGADSLGGIFCPRDWDDILCWPQTASGEIATLPCFDNLRGIPYNASGIATRVCMEGGLWNKTEYSGCKPFSPVPPSTDPGTLDITTGIYLFGYCVSLIALIIAAVIFISFKELRCLRNTIHSHLMVTYVLSDALWVLSVISTDQGRSAQNTSKATCFTFILLHYFHLTNFFWMFVEGLYLYVLVVQTFMTQSIRLRTYCVLGWGTPFLVVIIWSIAKWAAWKIDDIVSEPAIGRLLPQGSEEIEFNPVVCPWLHPSAYDWIYISSALLVLAANMVFLMQIMWVLITKLRSATSQETQQSRKAAKALVVLMPLLGITYFLVLIGPKKLPLFEHTRAFLLSTQGFLVALLYCFLNAEVRTAIRHRWNRMESFGGDLKCCCCCSDSASQQNRQNLRDWSPRSRTESIRLYTNTPSQHYRKRESSASETTTMTGVGTCNLNNGGGHGGLTGNGNTALITTMTGRRVSTTPLKPAFVEESDMV